VYERISLGQEELEYFTSGRIALMKKRRSQPAMCRTANLLFAFVALLAVNASSNAQSKANRASAMTALERRASLSLEAARSNPLELRNLLLKMPKGADLHNHLYGAVYAESWIRDAVEDHLCVDPAAIPGTKPVFSAADSQQPSSCANGRVSAADAFKDQNLYDGLIDAFSMRGFVPSSGVTGHDHFFRAFTKFSGVSESHLGEWLDEIATRADRQNEQYIELMHTPDFSHSAKAGYEIGWQEDLARFRDTLLAKGIAPDISAARAAIDADEAIRTKREHCGQPDASSACLVEIRYLCQVLRGFPKEQVFAQTIFCFELASVDPRFVGVNFVMPEDEYTCMTDYTQQIRMVGFLHPLYPKVHISLHAGELAPGLVPYEGLCCHIRLAVEQAAAERIGHGVDVLYEERPHELLKEMAAKHVMVEINLTSNDVILGIAGNDHPFPIYRKFGVPVALSTDDEGVSRIDLTHEYVRAVQTYGLNYMDLKQMVRTGLEHNFLPGASLWAAPDKFSVPVAACSNDSLGTDKPSSSCETFLKASEKARQQWELEHRFRAFESAL
jgi:adenosine deaminase